MKALDEVVHLMDRLTIQDLMVQYFVNVDCRVWQPVKDVFVPGTLVDYSGVLPIADAVPAEEVVDRIAAAIELYATTTHQMGNHIVVIDGDTAQAETWVTAIHTYADPERNGGRLPIAGLRYLDQLVRTEDGWRIQHRRVTTDWRAWWDRREPTYVGGVHQ